jgi:hypothetical protein
MGAVTVLRSLAFANSSTAGAASASNTNAQTPSSQLNGISIGGRTLTQALLATTQFNNNNYAIRSLAIVSLANLIGRDMQMHLNPADATDVLNSVSLIPKLQLKREIKMNARITFSTPTSELSFGYLLFCLFTVVFKSIRMLKTADVKLVQNTDEDMAIKLKVSRWLILILGLRILNLITQHVYSLPTCV